MTSHVFLTRATLVALVLALGAGESWAAKKARNGCSRFFDCKSEAEKARLRKAAMAVCTRKYGSTYKVVFKSNGNFVCWVF
jgi:hypothetical protein